MAEQLLLILTSSVLFFFIRSDCIEPCIGKMQKTLEMTPILQSDQVGQLSFTQLMGASANEAVTEQSFNTICGAYREVDKCLEQCEHSEENSGRIRQTYAGIRFICVEHNKEFFESLPCLAREEPKAMQQCRSEINASLVASNRFSTTVVNREQHNIRSRFENLCKQLGLMIECVEPVTRRGCGDDAAFMMLKFITVGFSSFEQLYSQLGISDQLPTSCRSLLSLRHKHPQHRVHHPNSVRQTGPLIDLSTGMALNYRLPFLTFVVYILSFFRLL